MVYHGHKKATCFGQTYFVFLVASEIYNIFQPRQGA